MSFGEKLSQLRRDNGLTQEMFAEQLKVSRQAVSKWESDRGYPELDKILYICNRYGVTMDTLFVDELPERSEEPIPDTAVEFHSKPLKRSVDDFIANLAPYDKMVILALLGTTLLVLFASFQYLKGGENAGMTIFWILAIVVFGVAEAATAGLVSIWFVCGGVAALLGAELNASVAIQLGLFFAVSIAALILTRPLARKMLDKTITPTNADRVLHHRAKVTEDIDNENACGAVYIDGKTWTARSEDGCVIPKGAMVTVVKMEGVKLFVRKEKED